MLIISLPIQIGMVLIIYKQRAKGAKITDKRVRLTTEVLQGIRLIKMYGWEAFYHQLINNFREKEMMTVRKSSYGNSLVKFLVYNVTYFLALRWLV